ncbi:hypothetical protein AMECASPLE_038354 [Ameca splendens]|uniref:Uncharacterized protein n=1 Tax=Ameca splendens TaxID=208324 RepID=A0ABV0XL96_9TELE
MLPYKGLMHIFLSKKQHMTNQWWFFSWGTWAIAQGGIRRGAHQDQICIFHFSFACAVRGELAPHPDCVEKAHRLLPTLEEAGFPAEAAKNFKATFSYMEEVDTQGGIYSTPTTVKDSL